MASCPVPIIAPPATFIPGTAVFHGEIGEPATAATPATPLPVLAVPGGANLSLIERLNREADPTVALARTSFSSFPTPTGAGTQIGGLPGVGVGRAVYIDTLSVWSTTPIAGRLQFDSGNSQWAGTGSLPVLDIGFGCGPTAQAQVKINKFIRSSDRTGLGALVSAWLDPAVTGTQVVTIGGNAWTMADSINFDARKVILMLGDSTWNGTGPSNVLTCVPWLINRFYRDQGQDTRYILKAYSGSASTGHENYRMIGRYEFPQVDAIFYNLGINDAAQGVSVATRTANVAALIAWKQKRYPKAKLVVFGTTPVQDNGQEAAIAAYRAADAAYIAGLGDPLVKFCNLGASFDRTVYANYVTSDPNGTAVHPRDQGLTPLWEGGYNGNPGLRAWLLANLPAI
jgi:lysophospholipase L1-like esterase